AGRGAGDAGPPAAAGADGASAIEGEGVGEMRPAAGADGVRPSATPAELCSLTIVGRVCRWATAVAGSSPVAEDVGEGEAPVLAAAGVGEAGPPAVADGVRSLAASGADEASAVEGVGVDVGETGPLTIADGVCRWAAAVAGSSPVAEDVGEGEAPVLAADERRLSSAWEPRASPSVP
ncbi:hypothetical protein, partial [Enterorhabdus sp. P55]|uniref:hypothetical protein n=1 Tax=Enterorhabdus sp. P55 TaxID=2304571 RepID=UPI00142C88E0